MKIINREKKKKNKNKKGREKGTWVGAVSCVAAAPALL
jgi:hypothetical protein